MNQQRPERIDEPASPERKLEWTTPEVDNLLAGAAESSDGADTDGADLLS